MSLPQRTASPKLIDQDLALIDYFNGLLGEVTPSPSSCRALDIEFEEDEPSAAMSNEDADGIADGAEPQAQIATACVGIVDDSSSLEDHATPSESQNQTGVAADTPCVSVSSHDNLGAHHYVDWAAMRRGEDEQAVPGSEPEAEDYFVEGAPAWAQRPFQVLEFSIARLKLAIPLLQLSGILDWAEAKLTPMPGHSKRFLGICPNHGIHSKIVDLSGLVVPERYHHKIEPWQDRINKVVLIDDSAWGLACDEIIGVVTLDPRQVRWRTARTQRGWLAGTLIERMSALVDGNELAAALLNE